LGGSFSYTLTVVNLVEASKTVVGLVDESLVYTAVIGNDGATLLCDLGTLAAEQSQTVQVTLLGVDEEMGVITAGNRLTYTATISNAGVIAAAYALALESGWTAGLEDAQTAVLSPGAAVTISFWVEPAVAGQETMTLTVRSLYDGGATAWATAVIIGLEPVDPPPTEPRPNLKHRRAQPASFPPCLHP
jgi:hypothetical protein